MIEASSVFKAGSGLVKFYNSNLAAIVGVSFSGNAPVGLLMSRKKTHTSS